MERGGQINTIRTAGLSLLILALVLNCRCNLIGETRNTEKQLNPIERIQDSFINPAGKTIADRVIIPDDFVRIPIETTSFASYLRHFPLKKHGSKVKLYDGSIKPGDKIYCAVLDIDIGEKDLQQCADAIIRLRAEYLFATKQYDKIHFTFTNGEPAEYKKFAEGYRARIFENNVTWIKQTNRNYSYQTFLIYLEMIFTYAGSYSLSLELNTVEDISKIQIGDVFIQGGFPGHAVIVVDVAINKTTGEKQFLLAQSYMPAQEIQLLLNPENDTPWFTTRSSGKLITPEWSFTHNDLKRFRME